MRILQFAFLFAAVGAATAQEIKCSEAKVKYEQPMPEPDRNVQLRPPGGTLLDGEDALSPQGTRSFRRTKVDYMKPGPWNTTLAVLNHSSGQELLRLEITNHGNTLDVAWINEKLLWVQVWWGRIASSDIIIDVEHKKIFYHEQANYGEVSFCKE